MIKKYYHIVKRYFQLGANNKKLLFHLFFLASLRSLTLLTIPFMASLITQYATDGEYVFAGISAIGFLVCSLLYIIAHHYNYVSYYRNSIYTHNKLQELILHKVSSMDENFTKKLSSPYIINTGYKDVGEVMQVPDQLADAITRILAVFITLGILLSVHLYIGIFTLLFLIIAFIVLQKNIDKRDYYLEKQRIQQDNVSGLMGQVIDGNKEIKAFSMEENLQTILNNYKRIRKKSYFKKRFYQNNEEVLVPAILGTGKIIVYLFLIHFILNGQFEVAILVLVIGYYKSIEDEFWDVYEVLDKIAENSVRVNRIHQILNYKNKNMINFGNHDNDFIQGKVEFKNVSFTYEKKRILKHIQFTIHPHTFTAIVGKSGSGKSTIFRLLLRLYKADKGEILLDDVSITDYTKEIYASNVSIVTQKPFIFDMSIQENLSLVDSNHEHQVEACKRAGIHDYIMSLKDGYHTKLVRDGENISSGQKQLIALARTLLSKSEVLLFDEVTSSLDLATSNKVMKILKDLKKDHTILMITHKPSLMKIADEILVIDDGKLVGKGTHKQLMKNNTYYKNLQK